MGLFDEILQRPEFHDRPPVLVDIGAAGGLPKAWRRIARYSIGVGFEPDEREISALEEARRNFRRWAFVPGLAVPAAPPGGMMHFNLTRSPQCSSVLRPDREGLRLWSISSLFEVSATRQVAAVTLSDGLASLGIDQVDWLKCDTQGMDLRLFLGLSESVRHRLLAVEMEPGFIDAYEGEDSVAGVLPAMRREPFWLARFDVQKTPRGSGAEISAELGARFARRHMFFGAGAPGWANLTYLRDFEKAVELLDCRSHLLGWVIFELLQQPAAALAVAVAGARRFRDELFGRMRAASRARIRRVVWSRWLRSIPLRLLRR